MWSNVSKPSADNWTPHNPTGKEQYDESDITYDEATVYYDSINPNDWSDVSKPTSSVWTNIAKPT